jgi:hypothetical protein
MQLRVLSVTELNGFTSMPTLYQITSLRVHRVLSASFECRLLIELILNGISSHGLVLHCDRLARSGTDATDRTDNSRKSSDLLLISITREQRHNMRDCRDTRRQEWPKLCPHRAPRLRHALTHFPWSRATTPKHAHQHSIHATLSAQ